MLGRKSIMYSYLSLKNYCSLNDITFNLKKTRDKTNKLAVIYGENSYGKSNLLVTFYLLNNLIYSFNLEKVENEINSIFKKEDKHVFYDLLSNFLRRNSFSFILKDSRTID